MSYQIDGYTVTKFKVYGRNRGKETAKAFDQIFTGRSIETLMAETVACIGLDPRGFDFDEEEPDTLCHVSWEGEYETRYTFVVEWVEAISLDPIEISRAQKNLMMKERENGKD